jgi:hypothetical protein
MVDTELLGLLGTRVAALANDVRVVGQDLSGAGRPLLGGSVPACEVVDEVTTHLATTANWVITCATALASLATAATQAAAAYRTADEDATARWAAMATAFDGFDDPRGSTTQPA